MNPHPELVDGVDVDAVANAVRGCPGVDDLAAGAIGSVVSYLPGRQLPGVSVEADHVTVQVRAHWGTVIPDLARQIRAAVSGLVDGRRVDVGVADLVDPPGWDEEQAHQGADRSEVDPWTTSRAGTPAAGSSEPTTPTAAATPTRSSPD